MGFNPLKLPATVIGFIGKLLGLAKKLNLAGKVQDFILKAETMRNMTGPEKFQYVLNQITANRQVKKWLETLKAKAVKAGMDGNAIYDKAYDELKAQVQATVDALNALGLLLPHTTKPVAGTPYAIVSKPADIEKLSSLG